jgi:cell division topological specificity factor MinE
MSDWLDHLLGKTTPSARQAKARLKNVLLYDRMNLTEADLSGIRDEIASVLSHHVGLDVDKMSISILQDGRKHRLVADVPLSAERRAGPANR